MIFNHSVLLSFLSPFPSVSVHILGFWPFHSGLFVSFCLWVSIPFSWSVAPPHISFLFNSGVCLSVSLSVGYFFSTSFSGFLYPSFIGFLPILFSLNIWSFLHFCVDFHLSWAFLIHSLGMSSLWASTTPFWEFFKKGKIFTHYPGFWLQYYISYSVCSCST